MLGMILSPLNSLAELLLAKTTPARLAGGFALGMMCGLVPKGNLTAMALFMLLCALSVNQVAGLLALAIFSAAAVFTDRYANFLGEMLLSSSLLRPLWTYLADLPLMPWTNFHNSLVLGNLLLGSMLAYPTYRVAFMVFSRVKSWRETLERYRVGTVLGYATTAASIRRREPS